jgi:hypothetical protein
VASFIDFALRYAALGWPVFPCDKAGKKPDGALAPQGFKNATIDPHRIRAWWSAHPEANIGIPCGASSGFWVLDVDPRNGGSDSLENLTATYGPISDTLTQSTGGGGTHFLFRHDPEVVKGKLGAGLDVKRDGGYIIVEPSVTAGSYGFLDWDVFEGGEPPIAPAPAWLLALVRAKPHAADQDGAEPWNADVAKLRSALAVLDADEYGDWITIGAALHHSSNGHPDALALWTQWSGKSAKFEHGVCEKRWETLGRYGGAARASVATIYYRASQMGWSWRAPKRARKEKEAETAASANAPPPGAPPAAASDERPQVRIREGELDEAVAEAEAVLRVRATDRIYQRLSSLVRVVRRQVPSVRNYRRPQGVLGVQEIDSDYLVLELTRLARWYRFDKRAEDWRRIDCPDKVARALLSKGGQWTLPRLWATISAPTLRPDGSLLQDPGYDPSTATFYDPGDVKFPVIAEKPSRADAEAALEQLRALVASFPFVNEWDESVALAMIMTGVVRRALPSAPLGAFSAPVGGSGKTLLSDIVAICATGVTAPAMQYAATDEEAHKTALAVLAEGDPIVLIDNIDRPLQGDWLCTALTSEIFRGRLLGKSETVSVPTTTLWLATGNQLVIRGDLTLRSLLCCIDPQMERPDERALDADALRRTVHERRPELVAACLTIMRAYIAEGCVPSDFVKPWGRFERWSDMIRAPLVWLGMADPCRSAQALTEEDPIRTEHVAVMSAWVQVFGFEPVTVRDLMETVETAKPPVDRGFPEEYATESRKAELANALKSALLEVASDRSGKISAKRAGYWLRSRANRKVGGMQIVMKGKTHGIARWAVLQS